MYTNIEIFLANFSFLTLFISMLIYWIQASSFEAQNKANPDLVTNQNQMERNFPNKQQIGSMFNRLYKTRAIATFTTIIANGSLFLLLVIVSMVANEYSNKTLKQNLM